MEGQNNEPNSKCSRDVLRYVKQDSDIATAVANSPVLRSRLVNLATKKKIDKECIEQAVVKYRYRNLIDTYGH